MLADRISATAVLWIGIILLFCMPLRLAAEGDPERGRVLADTCMGCHGIEGYSNVYPTYKVPKLGGQYGEYVAKALTGYRDGARQHGTMHGQASSMTDQEIQDIAAYVGSLGVLAPTDPTAGTSANTAPESAALCVACHGQTGVSIAFAFPHLAGQHKDYLVETLKQYKSGVRTDVSMAAFLNTMTEEEMEELAAYYASQPGLMTLNR